MRLEKYLTEKFFDGFGNDYYIEIFKNPSRRDLRDVEDDNGYRVFIDLKNKNVYVAPSEVFHMQMLDGSDKLYKELKLDWGKYWDGKDKTNSYIIMGDANPFMQHFNADSLHDLAYNEPERTAKNLRKMLTYDFNWLSKYGFTPKSVRNFVEDRYEESIEKLEEVS